MASVPSVIALRLRIDGEYLALEVMRRALRDVAALHLEDPYCATTAKAAGLAERALAAASQLEAADA